MRSVKEKLSLKLIKDPTAVTQILRPQQSKLHTIAMSSLFTVTGVPVAGFVDEARVNLFGLETRVFITEMKTVYVFDEVELPEQLPDDRTIGRILSAAEKEYGRKEVDPYGVLGTEDERRYNIKTAIEILVLRLRRHHAALPHGGSGHHRRHAHHDRQGRHRGHLQARRGSRHKHRADA
jgi:hypothetical protein